MFTFAIPCDRFLFWTVADGTWLGRLGYDALQYPASDKSKWQGCPTRLRSRDLKYFWSRWQRQCCMVIHGKSLCDFLMSLTWLSLSLFQPYYVESSPGVAERVALRGGGGDGRRRRLCFKNSSVECFLVEALPCLPLLVMVMARVKQIQRDIKSWESCMMNTS